MSIKYEVKVDNDLPTIEHVWTEPDIKMEIKEELREELTNNVDRLKQEFSDWKTEENTPSNEDKTHEKIFDVVTPVQEADDQHVQADKQGISRSSSSIVKQDPCELLQFVRKSEEDGKYYCTLCAKYSHKWSSCTRNHVESKHFPTTYCYPCNECDSLFYTKTAFNLHRSTKHTAKKYKYK